jgi:hypothetical protein
MNNKIKKKKEIERVPKSSLLFSETSSLLKFHHAMAKQTLWKADY